MIVKYYKIIMGSIVFIIFCIVFFIFALITEKSPIWYSNIPFPVAETKTYKPGDDIRFVVDRCASKIVTYTVAQSYIAESATATIKEFYLPSAEASVLSLSPQCQTVLGIPTTILQEMPTGWYHKKHNISVKGRFRDFIIVVNSQPFYVKNDSPSIQIVKPQTLPVPVIKQSQTVVLPDNTVFNPTTTKTYASNTTPSAASQTTINNNYSPTQPTQTTSQQPSVNIAPIVQPVTAPNIGNDQVVPGIISEINKII